MAYKLLVLLVVLTFWGLLVRPLYAPHGSDRDAVLRDRRRKQ